MSFASNIWGADTPKHRVRAKQYINTNAVQCQPIYNLPNYGWKSAKGTKGWESDLKYAGCMTMALVENDNPGKKVYRVIANLPKYGGSIMPSIRREATLLRNANPDDIVFLLIWDAQQKMQCYTLSVMQFLHILSPSSSTGSYQRCNGGHRTKVYADTVFTQYHSRKYTRQMEYWFDLFVNL